jgi:hypothetical protein
MIDSSSIKGNARATARNAFSVAFSRTGDGAA